MLHGTILIMWRCEVYHLCHVNVITTLSHVDVSFFNCFFEADLDFIVKNKNYYQLLPISSRKKLKLRLLNFSRKLLSENAIGLTDSLTIWDWTDNVKHLTQ